MRTYVYTYVRTCIRTYVHTYIYTCMHTYIHTHIYIYIYTYIHTYLHTYIHAYIHIRVHVHCYVCKKFPYPCQHNSHVSLYHRTTWDLTETNFLRIFRGFCLQKAALALNSHCPSAEITFGT